MVSGQLSVQLQGQFGAFQLAVDFDVPPGITVLFGASGSGKTTVLDCLSGLKTAGSGIIRAGSKTYFDSSKGINIPAQARNIGYVFQKPALFPHLNVTDNVCFGIRCWSQSERLARLDELFSLFQLENLSSRNVTDLSGGETQRVALARALARKPGLLLLDEPFSAMDQPMRHELSGTIAKLHRNFALPVVLVTHSRQEALSIADTVVFLAGGRVRHCGTPQETLLAERHNFDENMACSW